MPKTRIRQRRTKTENGPDPWGNVSVVRRVCVWRATHVWKAEQLASQRRQTLSASIAELMEQSLRSHRFKQDKHQSSLKSLQKAFASFSEEEMLMLDGEPDFRQEAGCVT